MNKKVIIINGGIGSEKSSLRSIAGKFLSEELGKTACLDLDDLYKSLDNNFSAQGKELENNWLLARKYLATSTDFFFGNEVECVFVVGPFFTQEEVKPYIENIKTNCGIFLYTLKPDDETIKARILKRGDKEKNEEWIKNYLNLLKPYYRKDMEIINNSNLTPQQTLKEILNLVKINRCIVS